MGGLRRARRSEARPVRLLAPGVTLALACALLLSSGGRARASEDETGTLAAIPEETLPPAKEDPAPDDETGRAGDEQKDGFDGIGVPLLNFDSDLGFGIGAVGGLYLYRPGYEPYQHGLAAQVFFTTRGVHSHFLSYDGIDVFGDTRLDVRAEYRRELYAPYYGPGNHSAPTYDGSAKNARFSYDKLAPGFRAKLRGRPFGEQIPLEVYGGYEFRQLRILSYGGSLLAEQAPVGFEGGRAGTVSFGLFHDSRDHEATPTSGGTEELSVRGAAGVTGSQYQYGGVTAVGQRYWSIGPRLVVAQRVVVDWLFGDVPFFEWPNTGGLKPAEGIGGMSSVRGTQRHRFVGNLKAFSNTELRALVTRFTVFSKSLDLTGLAFFDAGRVWHPGVPDGHFFDWHPGLGGGLRVSRRAAVLRFDYAYAPREATHGIYVTFGHMF